MKFNNINKIILCLCTAFVSINRCNASEHNKTLYLSIEEQADAMEKIGNFVKDGTSKYPVYTTSLDCAMTINVSHEKHFDERVNSAFRHHVNINRYYTDEDALMRNPEFLSMLFKNEQMQIVIPGRSNKHFMAVWRWITRCQVVLENGGRFASISLIGDIFHAVLKNIRDRYCISSDLEFEFVMDEINTVCDLGFELKYLTKDNLSARFYKSEILLGFIEKFKNVVEKYYPFPYKSLPELKPEQTEYYEEKKPKALKSVYDWKMFPNMNSLVAQYNAYHNIICTNDEITKKYSKAREHLVSLAQLCIDDLSKFVSIKNNQ